MDLLTALKILIRRWPVVLAGLVLTVVGVYQVGNMVKPSYEAKGQVWLIGSGPGNNLLEFPPGLQDTAGGLVVILQSPDQVKALKAEGGTASYTLLNSDKTVIQVTADGPNKAETVKTANLVIDKMQKQLDSQQATSPAAQHIRVQTLESPTPSTKMGSRIRAMAAVGAIGLAATVAAGLLTDAVIRQMREAKLRREEDEDAEAWTPSHARDGYQAAFEARPPSHGTNGAHAPAAGLQPAMANGANGANGHSSRTSVYRPPARSGASEGSSYRDLVPGTPRPGESRPQGDATRPPSGSRPSSPAAPASAPPRPSGDPRSSSPARQMTDPRTAGQSRPAGDPRSSSPATADPRAAAPPRTSQERRPAPASPPNGDARPSTERRPAPDPTHTHRP